MSGFTAFRDDQEIDFEPLDLFAISGPTGSGKSSLLDAITYALYGYVERVGRQVGQLVSQGLPRMSVVFDFAVGDDRYRIARTTPASGGATKVLLQRADGDGWTQAGDGADRVGMANAYIVELLGLDYDSFTRSVLLPQGKFAEFLAGDASKRREILTDLLGLSLFKDMAQRAGEIARDASARATSFAEVIDKEYAGIDDDALARASTAVAGAEAREAAIAAASAKIADIAARRRDARETSAEIGECLSLARRTAALFDESAGAVAASAQRLAKSGPVLERLFAAARDSAATAEKTARERRETETAWGGIGTLATARGRAVALAEARARLASFDVALAAEHAKVPSLDAAVATATEHAHRTTTARTQAETNLREARVALESARRADLAAAICDGLHPGDDCPVCGGTLATVLGDEAGTALADARTAEDAATAALAQAERALTAAEHTRRDAVRDRAQVDREVARISADITREHEAVTAHAGALAAVLGEPLPSDPAGELASRMRQLEALATAEEAARRAAADAAEALAAAQRTRAQIDASVAAARAALDAREPSAIARRAAEAIARARTPGAGSNPEAADGPFLQEPAESNPAAISSWAAAVAKALSVLADELDSCAAETDRARRALVDEAAAALDGLAPRPGSLEDAERAVSSAAREAAGAVASARAAAVTMTDRIASLGDMRGQVADLGARADAFRALATELRADRLIAFLQNEALQVLCVAGTSHLSALSDGRYRLETDGDEFHVVDVWNGEERRSVKTLSGGETFLASLALSLALAEQVQSLSVTQTARLESLFIDEGFGSLDVESLEQVVQAIEQLGGDGRVVGVITHIVDLAERLPHRIIVEKSPRGSRVRSSPAPDPAR